MRTTGIYIIAAWVDGGEIVAPFVVCEDLNADAIIGMNVIRRFGLYPSPSGRVGFIRQVAAVTTDLGNDTGILIATKSTTIAPFEAKLVKTQLRAAKLCNSERPHQLRGQPERPRVRARDK